MKNKVLVSGLTSLLLILSCQMDGNNLGKINTKNSFKIASNNEPVPESSSGIFPNYDTEQFNKDELEQSSQKSVLDVNSIANKKQTLNFDSPPPDTAPIVDGVIIVFYHNNDKFRVKTSNSISSTNQSNSNQVNAILEKYNVKSIQSSGYYDPADKNKIVCKSEKKKKESEDDKKFKTKSKNNDHENENEDNDKEKEPDNDKCNTLNYVDSSVTTQKIAEQQQLMSTLYNGEFPDDLSVHVYNFPPNVNTRQIAKELRSLPFIRTAYPALQYSSSSIGNNCSVSSSLLGLTTPSSVGAKSSDPFFTNITNVPNPDFFGSYETRPADKNKDYYWFDRHQIFRGWEIIDSNGGVESPKIAVIDEGFDVDQNALDRPNYLSGYSITYNPVWWRPWSNFDIKNGDLKSKLSPSWHGSEVSSVIGSPRNNGQGLAGVAPQTQILPIRVAQSRQYIYGLNAKSTTSSLEIKEALNMASSEPTIDVINISLTSEGIVLPEDPIVLKAVADAIAKNKVVAIAAGNSMSPIDPKVTIPNGCMIVGGTSNRKQVLYDKRHIPLEGKPKNLPSDNGTYIWIESSYGNAISISASAEDIILPSINDRNGRKEYIRDSGTSFSAPMVSASAGLVKKLAKKKGVNLSPAQIQNIIVYSSKAVYDENFIAFKKAPFITETRYLGANLSNKTNNPFGNVNARNLDLYNALKITENLANYSTIVRVHNVDDYGSASVNTNNVIFNGYKTDQIIGINNPNNYKITLDFKTLNAKSNLGYDTSYSYGYQIFSGKKYDGGNSDFLAGYNIYDELDGMAGVYGAENNSAKPEGYLAGRRALINQNGATCNPLYFIPKVSYLYGGKIGTNVMDSTNTLAEDVQNLKTISGNTRFLGVSGNISNAKISIDGIQQTIIGTSPYAIAFNVSNNLTSGSKNITITTDAGTITLPNAISIQNPVSDKYYIRIFNVDDTGYAYVNLNKVLQVGYNGDSGFVEVTNLLKQGANTINFQLYNGPSGYTWGFQIKKNNNIIFQDVLGSAGSYGANGNDQSKTYQIVYDKSQVIYVNSLP